MGRKHNGTTPVVVAAAAMPEAYILVWDSLSNHGDNISREETFVTLLVSAATRKRLMQHALGGYRKHKIHLGIVYHGDETFRHF